MIVEQHVLAPHALQLGATLPPTGVVSGRPQTQECVWRARSSGNPASALNAVDV